MLQRIRFLEFEPVFNVLLFSHFYQCFTSLVLQAAPPSPGLHSLWTEAPAAPPGTPSNMSQYFDLYDVKESSYHTFISRLDLHICNDSSSMDEGQSGIIWQSGVSFTLRAVCRCRVHWPSVWLFTDEASPPGVQGAMQLTFRKLGFDFYPVHRPGECGWCLESTYPLSCPLSDHHSQAALPGLLAGLQLRQTNGMGERVHCAFTLCGIPQVCNREH